MHSATAGNVEGKRHRGLEKGGYLLVLEKSGWWQDCCECSVDSVTHGHADLWLFIPASPSNMASPVSLVRSFCRNKFRS